MFGMAHVCRHQLTDDLRDQWLAHMCGLCLSLRDTHGQLSRAVTNTDAITLSILVEAQQDGRQERVLAGRCALRGMRTAAVVPVEAVSARLGRTASLTLAAAKAQDVVAEQQYGLTERAPVRAAAANRVASRLRRQALADEPMAQAVHAVGLLEQLADQGRVERSVRPGDQLDAVTEAAARSAEEVFAASAEAAGRPENEAALRRLGRAYGALAHLVDAVEDLDDDRRRGRFNPLLAAGWGPRRTRELCQRLVREIRDAFGDLNLRDDRLARLLLVDGSAAAVRKAFGAAGIGRAGHGIACGAAGSSSMSEQPGQNPSGQYLSGQYPPGSPIPSPALSPSADQAVNPELPPVHAAVGQYGPTDSAPGQYPPQYPPPNYPPPQDTPPQQPPQGPPDDWPTPPPGNRRFWPNLFPWIGVYCCGVACCAEHTNPCTGRRHQPACGGGCGGCDGCDGCDGCSGCCDCCDCCDGCCCDC